MLDYNEADQLLRAGLSQREVAARYGVTQSAIAAARRRGMLKEGNTAYQSALPWRVRPEHLQLNVAKMLRCVYRLERGEAIGESNRRAVDSFIAGLQASDAVIHYDPEVSPYFFRVPRRPGVDLGWVRDPSVEEKRKRR